MLIVSLQLAPWAGKFHFTININLQNLDDEVESSDHTCLLLIIPPGIVHVRMHTYKSFFSTSSSIMKSIEIG